MCLTLLPTRHATRLANGAASLVAPLLSARMGQRASRAGRTPSLRARASASRRERTSRRRPPREPPLRPPPLRLRDRTRQVAGGGEVPPLRDVRRAIDEHPLCPCGAGRMQSLASTSAVWPTGSEADWSLCCPLHTHSYSVSYAPLWIAPAGLPDGTAGTMLAFQVVLLEVASVASQLCFLRFPSSQS